MDYQYIGKLGGSHGLDGKLVLRHQLEGKNIWSKIKHVFVEVRRESYIPYFIESQQTINHEEVLLQLDEIDSLEMAKTLSGKKVYLENEVFARLQPKAVSGNMIGFKIMDESLGELGIIEDLFETPGQVVATIQYKGKEAIIPLIDSTIKNIDAARKIITVTLPDGLMEVYL